MIDEINTREDLVELVNEIGFLPFFSGRIEAFLLKRIFHTMRGIRADGAARSIGMPGTGKDRFFRTKNLSMASSLRRRQAS